MSLINAKPLTITDAMIISTDVPMEADFYNATTTYGAGAQCIDPSNHKVYTSVAAGNVGNTPRSSPSAWTEQRLANRWRAIDSRNSTKTVKEGGFSYRIRPGRVINSVGVMECHADSVRVRVVDPTAGTVYDKTVSLLGRLQRSSMYDFFFSPRVRKKRVVLLDLPPYYGADILIDVVANGEASVGNIVFGYQRRLGSGVQYGMALGLTDLSKEVVDAWGENELKEGGYKTRLNLTFNLRNSELEIVFDQLVDLRATPCLWIVELPEGLAVAYGWAGDFDILVKYATQSDCNLQIKGLT